MMVGSHAYRQVDSCTHHSLPSSRRNPSQALYHIMNIFPSLSEMVFSGPGPILGALAVSSCLYYLVDHVPIPRWLDKKANLIGQMNPEGTTGLECPYEYIRQIYGKYHWAPFVHKLSPNLREDDYSKYLMVLEIMDAIHLCLMLVDDVRTKP
jgi:geranylgeranyldiphosphate transferase